jgi:lipopolysaccharide transport system permease protein
LSEAIPLPGRRRPVDLAWRDLVEALRHWPLIVHLGWQDVRQRYRRSLLGPLWLTVSVGVQIGSLGLVYGELFHLDLASYLPHLAVGMTVWQLNAAMINDGCLSFIAGESYLKQVALPKMIFPARVVLRSLITFAHDVVIVLVVLVIYTPPSFVGILGSLVGLFMLAVNGLWVGLLFGMGCSRFRDLPPIVGSVLQVAFFLTPVIWIPSTLTGHWKLLLVLNPFASFLSLVRDPLLGETPSLEAWGIVLGVTAIGWILAFAMFVRYRARITYWL